MGEPFVPNATPRQGGTTQQSSTTVATSDLGRRNIAANTMVLSPPWTSNELSDASKLGPQPITRTSVPSPCSIAKPSHASHIFRPRTRRNRSERQGACSNAYTHAHKLPSMMASRVNLRARKQLTPLLEKTADGRSCRPDQRIPMQTG